MFCKYCGKQFDDLPERCPSCGKTLRQPEQEEQPERSAGPDARKKLFLAGGVILAVILTAVVAMIVNGSHCAYGGCRNKVSSGSSYCYEHKCRYGSCPEKAWIYSEYCYTHRYFDESAGALDNPVFSYQLNISNIKLENSSSYTVATGTITNNSSSTVTYVKIKGSFKNSRGQVVDTDWTYAVDSSGLAPGESCKWRLSVDKDWNITECDVTVLDFDY